MAWKLNIPLPWAPFVLYIYFFFLRHHKLITFILLQLFFLWLYQLPVQAITAEELEERWGFIYVPLKYNLDDNEALDLLESYYIDSGGYLPTLEQLPGQALCFRDLGVEALQDPIREPTDAVVLKDLDVEPVDLTPEEFYQRYNFLPWYPGDGYWTPENPEGERLLEVFESLYEAKEPAKAEASPPQRKLEWKSLVEKSAGIDPHIDPQSEPNPSFWDSFNKPVAFTVLLIEVVAYLMYYAS